MKSIVVIGNGATAVDGSGACYLNKHTAAFLEELSEADVGPTVFVQPRISYSPGANLHDSACDRSVTNLVFGSSWRERGFLANIAKVIRTIVIARFVYIFYPGKFPEWAARLCRAMRKPYGIYLRGDPSVLAVGAQSLSDADFVITVSESLAREHGASGRITRIRPMLDLSETDIFRRHERRGVQRTWRLLFVGRIETAKGITELLAAAEIMHSQGLKFRLTIVGGGPLLEQTRAHVSGNGDLPVDLLGPILAREQLAEIYRNNDILVLPTHHEGIPRVLYEAMIRSVVVVSTPVGGIPELLAHDVNSVLVPVGNANALAEAVMSLCADPSRLQKLSEAGLETALKVIRTFPSHAAAFKEAVDAQRI